VRDDTIGGIVAVVIILLQLLGSWAKSRRERAAAAPAPPRRERRPARARPAGPPPPPVPQPAARSHRTARQAAAAPPPPVPARATPTLADLAPAVEHAARMARGTVAEAVGRARGDAVAPEAPAPPPRPAPGLVAQPWRAGNLVRSAWVQQVRDAPGFLGEVVRTLLAPAGTSEDAAVRVARGLAASWAAELLAEAATAVQLGPAAVRALVDEVRARPVADRIRIDLDDRGLVTGPPPPHLRVLVACHALEATGQEAAAADLLESWRRLMPERWGYALRGPLAIESLPADVIDDEVAAIARDLVLSHLIALGGRTLEQVADRAGLDAAAARADEVRQAMLRREDPSAEGIRPLLVAACGLSVHDPLPAELVRSAWSWLGAARAARPVAPGAPALAAAPRRSGRHAAVREALLLSFVLEPPRALAPGS
jgi:hypothetical protein